MAGIGKGVIENLTTAMYEQSLVIYREYIQNAADSIDKAISAGIITKEDAVIDILIEYGKRRITINDNAMGVSKDKFYRILSDIADSEKDRNVDKGFRGIGRLGGLAYCDKLIFSSSVLGENVKTVMIWDGVLLRQILVDGSQHPSASELVDKLITCRQEKCGINEHFFEVTLEGVIAESNDLLDVTNVNEYLQEVAPIPYGNTFSYRSKIYEFANQSGLQLDEYCVLVNGNQMFKPYKNRLLEGTQDDKATYDEVSNLEFRTFKDRKGNLLGWLWFAVTRYEKQIPIINKMRGIRIRKKNIQIGTDETLSYPKFYKEPRGNYYFIGELFAVSNELIPNARRDYFNTNSTLREFEDKIIPVLYTEFYSLYHYASKVKKSFQKTAEYEKKKQEYQEKINQSSFIDNEEKNLAKRDLEKEKAKVAKANRELELRKKDAEKNNVLNRVYKELEMRYKPLNIQDSEGQEKEDDNKKNKKYLTQSLSKYNKKEQKLISRIYATIKLMLPKDMAEMVVAKLQEELSK